MTQGIRTISRRRIKYVELAPGTKAGDHCPVLIEESPCTGFLGWFKDG